MKQIAVLGLGRFGYSVALSLSKQGVEVLGVDNDADKVADIAPEITNAVQADLMDPDALDSLGLRNFDVVVLCIKKVEISCLTYMAIRDRGAKFVVAQASSDGHAKILERIGADKVIMPEKDMGTRVARSLADANIIDYMELSANHSLVEFTAPEEWVGHTLQESNIRNKFGINVVAIRSDSSLRVAPRGDDIVHDGDIMVVIGANEDVNKFSKFSDSRKKSVKA